MQQQKALQRLVDKQKQQRQAAPKRREEEEARQEEVQRAPSMRFLRPVRAKKIKKKKQESSRKERRNAHLRKECARAREEEQSYTLYRASAKLINRLKHYL